MLRIALAAVLAVTLLPCALANNSRMLQGYKNDLGEVKSCILSVGIFDCIRARNAASSATSKAQSYANSRYWSQASLHNGRGDAFRHCYWNALMVHSIGSGQAKEVADGHENASKSPKAEKSMDLYNNSRGRSIGKVYKSSSAAATACRSAALKGSLRVCCGFTG